MVTTEEVLIVGKYLLKTDCVLESAIKFDVKKIGPKLYRIESTWPNGIECNAEGEDLMILIMEVAAKSVTLAYPPRVNGW